MWTIAGRLKYCGSWVLKGRSDVTPTSYLLVSNSAQPWHAHSYDSPTTCLLDQPFASLNTPFRLELRRVLLRILRQLDLSVVLVTHDPQEAYELVEAVIVVSGNRVLQQGKREDVFSSQSSAIVARLLGFRNMFQGEVVSSTRQTSVIKVAELLIVSP